MPARSDPARSEPRSRTASDRPFQWAKVIDHESCIGCHACTTACKSENEVPLSVTRTFVKYVDVGAFPEARRAFQVTRCNQCGDPPCTHACPTAAMYRRDDGIVDFDKTACIGCKACIAACPYDAIFINPQDHSAEKCNFCAHRIDIGLEPACVTVCPTQSILVGNMNDPSSRVAHYAAREAGVAVRRPEKDTRPKLFYKGAHQATLDPLAAERPPGGLLMWSEQGDETPVSGPSTSSAAAVLAYDIPHRAPWDWRVSLYTLTKSIAAGAWLVAWLLVALGAAAADGTLWTWAAPLVGAGFLAVTGAILISDLEHPGRFLYLFTRSQWRSWLVRGAYIIAAYSVVLMVHAGASLTGAAVPSALPWLGIPLALATSVYTAYLFAQAKARDLWQSPLLPPHLAVQAVIAGAAALLPVAAAAEPGAVTWLARILAAASAAHLLLIGGELSLTHATAHARLAVKQMTHGRCRGWFRVGIIAGAAALAAPWLAGVSGAAAAAVAAPAALFGLFAYEHAYVQAGQSVPLT